MLLQKSVYPYEYKNDSELFNDKSLPEKEYFYSHLNMEDITEADYAYAKKFCKDFEIKKLAEYHVLYVPSDTLLLADYLRTFEIYVSKYTNMILQNFFKGLAWQVT